MCVCFMVYLQWKPRDLYGIVLYMVILEARFRRQAILCGHTCNKWLNTNIGIWSSLIVIFSDAVVTNIDFCKRAVKAIIILWMGPIVGQLR